MEHGISKVYGGKYQDRNGLTVLDVRRTYPNEVLTIVIKKMTARSSTCSGGIFQR